MLYRSAVAFHNVINSSADDVKLSLLCISLVEGFLSPAAMCAALPIHGDDLDDLDDLQAYHVRNTPTRKAATTYVSNEPAECRM